MRAGEAPTTGLMFRIFRGALQQAGVEKRFWSLINLPFARIVATKQSS